ncbi:MAG: multicopper oxidase domain-containing protein [Proteobacteria bacterium]|nr:multicopper oxidase domain-containing protein [Pseudomonadota bacterium]
MKLFIIFLSLLSTFYMGSGIAKDSFKKVRYELVATQETVNVSGKKSVDFALLLNGQLPAPTLEFTEGDEAEITIKNQIPDQELSIHWHGILLPNEVDGVPYLNTPPIHSGESFTFKFKLRQSGTYWYHTHTNVQEQKGLYGAFIVHPREKTIAATHEAVLVLSDWSDEDALDILAHLRKDGDYYLYKKGTVRSWFGAFQAHALANYIESEWTRMGGMDFSDVGYDAFLINGKHDAQLLEAHPGEKVRLRIINAAASTYFYVQVAEAPMNIIAADGKDIQAMQARELLIGMAETYDVLFEVPDHKNYEFKITAQDGSGSASAWIGMGEKVFAPLRPKPELYETMHHSEHGMDHTAHMKPQLDEHAEHGAPPQAEKPSSGAGIDPHAGHHMMSSPVNTPGAIIESFSVDEIKALDKISFPKTAPIHDVKLVLDGDMERYIWNINGQAIFEDRTIEIKEGERVRFTFVNESMMHHPMHLHGHFFRVQNKYQEFSPWKHTVDVPPHSTRIIEFLADEPGEWMLHCHNLYHMKTGMARVIKYSSFSPKPEIIAHQKHDPHNHDHTYYYGMLEAATNHAQARFRLMQTWNEVEARLETRKDYSWDLEGDLLYKRWLNKYLNLNLGGSRFANKSYAVAGFSYILPMMIEAKVLINHEAKLRVDLGKRFQWTASIFSDADVMFRQNELTEWEASIMYADHWAWSFGLKFTGESTGLGVQYQF